VGEEEQKDYGKDKSDEEREEKECKENKVKRGRK